MTRRHEDRKVLITGGGSGIGQATVLRFLAEGAHVVAADISQTGLDDTHDKAGEASDRLHAVVMDIGDEQSVQAGVAEAVRLLGGLDSVVN
ncbi:MAG: SDR family NAD(P)-dependent oxidoreductase, partial [Curtobacterium sp.]